MTNKSEMAERRALVGSTTSTTYHSLTHLADPEPSGRFGRIAEAERKAIANGTSSTVEVPRLPASSPWGDGPSVGVEPPLGYAIDAQEPVGEVAEVEASAAELAAAPEAPTSAPSSPDVVETGAAVIPAEAKFRLAEIVPRLVRRKVT